jgi:cytochrome P450
MDGISGINGFWYHVMIFMTSLFVLKLLIISRKAAGKLPPGPPGWPIVGNLLQLGEKPNQSLYHLAAKYGPLMTLRLGMKTAVVVSSPAMAKEVLKTHDQVFSGRTVIEAAKYLSYGDSSLVWNNCGPRWRMLRRLCNTELFSVKRLEALQHLRRDQVFSTLQSIFEDSTKGKGVNIGHTVFLTSLNLLCNLIFSQNMFERDSQAAIEFKETVTKLVVISGKPNLADYFPFLRILDPQGVSRDAIKYINIVFGLLEKPVEARLQSRKEGRTEHSGAKAKDFLDILVEYRSDSEETFTKKDIITFLYILILAGSETSSSTIEWAIAEAIRNPRVMKKVQAELEEVIGKDRRVEETDIDRLPYLQAVVKEVFRLHPPAPLLIPHRAESTCEVAGYMIPKDTQVLVNAWAIGRDPIIWNEPLEFKPERFMGSELEYWGQNFELIPFGAGRRICPGLPLAHRIVHVVIASLLHSFDWSLPNGITPHNLDMTEKFGIALQRALPLIAVPTPRLPSHLLNAQYH